MPNLRCVAFVDGTEHQDAGTWARKYSGLAVGPVPTDVMRPRDRDGSASEDPRAEEGATTTADLAFRSKTEARGRMQVAVAR